MTRIQFFTQYCHRAGTYFRSHNLALGLARRGHEVTVFAADADPAAPARTETRDGVAYHITPEWRGARLFSQACHPGTALSRALANYPPADVAHLFQPFPSGAAAWRRAARSAAVRCFDWDDLWVGGLMRGVPRSPDAAWRMLTVGALEQRLPSAADHVTVCSDFLAELARRRGARGVQVVPNGVWPQAAAPRGAARAHFGLDAGATVFGFMGHTLGELDWCLEGLARALVRHPRLTLAFCGPPLRALADWPAAVRDRVAHLGQLPPEEVPRFVAALDLGLLPLDDTPFNRSRFPVKFAEYLGGGAPVLLSAVGDLARISRDWPWVLPAGLGRASWLEAFVAAAGRAEAGELPRVDAAAVAGALSWDAAAALLERRYAALLGARPG